MKRKSENFANSQPDLVIGIPGDVFMASHENELVIPIYAYCWMRRTRDAMVAVSLQELCDFCGIRANSQKGRSFDRCRDALGFLFREDFITELPEPFTKAEKLEWIPLSHDPLKFGKQKERFAIISCAEIDDLRSFKAVWPKPEAPPSIAFPRLLRVLSYLRFWQSPQRFAGKTIPFLVARPLRIADELSISRSSLANALEVLIALDIIACQELPRKVINGNWCASPVIFVSKTGDWQRHLQLAQLHMESRYRKKFGGSGHEHPSGASPDGDVTPMLISK